MEPGSRYTTVVNWAKVILPTLGLGLLSSLFLFSNTTDPENALPFADIDLDQITSEQRLSQPRFASTLDDGREVTLVADSAVQTGVQTDRIALENVWLDMALNDEERALLRSDRGTVFLGQQFVDLMGDVLTQTDGGLTLRSDAMTVAMAGDTMRVVSPGPVRGTGPGFMLTAGAMELTGAAGAEVAHFTNGVRLVYDPPN